MLDCTNSSDAIESLALYAGRACYLVVCIRECGKSLGSADVASLLYAQESRIQAEFDEVLREAIGLRRDLEGEMGRCRNLQVVHSFNVLSLFHLWQSPLRHSDPKRSAATSCTSAWWSAASTCRSAWAWCPRRTLQDSNAGINSCCSLCTGTHGAEAQRQFEEGRQGYQA